MMRERKCDLGDFDGIKGENILNNLQFKSSNLDLVLFTRCDECVLSVKIRERDSNEFPVCASK